MGVHEAEGGQELPQRLRHSHGWDLRFPRPSCSAFFVFFSFISVLKSTNWSNQNQLKNLCPAIKSRRLQMMQMMQTMASCVYLLSFQSTGGPSCHLSSPERHKKSLNLKSGLIAAWSPIAAPWSSLWSSSPPERAARNCTFPVSPWSRPSLVSVEPLLRVCSSTSYWWKKKQNPKPSGEEQPLSCWSYLSFL